MRDSIFYLLLVLLIAWIIAGSWLHRNHYCGDEDTTTKVTEKAAVATTPPVKEVAKKAALGAWLVNDGNAFKTTSNDHFRFNKSKFVHLTPRSKSLDASVQKTAAYLKKNPKRSLKITGYYRENEKNESIFPNLGLARANNVKSQLTAAGVAGSQLDTDSKVLSNEDWYKGNILEKGVDFSFADAGANTDRLAAIKKRLFGKPIILYFGTNQSSISLTSQQRKDFSDLIYYLDNVNTSRLDIEGHTDNVGNRGGNVKLSKDRAKFAQNYLNKNGGISTNRTKVNGFGPDKPLGSNDTAEGKAKNRRVEVTLR